MEKDGYLSWQSDSHHTAVSAAAERKDEEAESSSLLSCFPALNCSNWEQLSCGDQTTNFESALSSLVSSPSSSSNPPPPYNNNNSNPNPFDPPPYNNNNLPPTSSDTIVIRELIGRLGSICSSSSNCAVGELRDNEISPYDAATTNNNNNNNNNSYYCPNSTNTSCYTTPLNSPPKLLNLAIMDNNHHQHLIPPSPGFAERAAARLFSSYGARNSSYNPHHHFQEEAGKLSRASSTHSLTALNLTGTAGIGIGMGGQSENHDLMMKRTWSTVSDSDNNNYNNNSSHQQEASDRNRMAPSEGNIRKRKATKGTNSNGNSSSRGGGKEAPPPLHVKLQQGGEAEDPISKRRKSGIAKGGADKDAATTKALKLEGGFDSELAQEQHQGKEQDNNNDRDNSAKPPEPPKQDYIHVRARRGQATDSHSLAERVRREKISERMKFLQDLVPGCNKVTGKAVMLDEIINYVQSLQRQVEFLSMKLATVNPRLEFNVDSLLSKDMHHQPSHGLMIPPQPSFPLEACASYGNLDTQLDVPTLRRSLGMQLPPLEGFTDSAASQLGGALWEDDLHSVVHMGFGHNSEATFSSHNSQGRLPTTHMEIEL